jgi:hypothetical protein
VRDCDSDAVDDPVCEAVSVGDPVFEAASVDDTDCEPESVGEVLGVPLQMHSPSAGAPQIW